MTEKVNDDLLQDLIFKAWEQVINDCKSLEELLRQPINGKIATYSPSELSEERKRKLLKLYNRKGEELRNSGRIDRFFSRMDEIINL